MSRSARVVNSQVGNFVDRLTALSAALCAILVVGMCLHIILDVSLRYFLRSPLPGTIDLVQYWWMPGAALMALGRAELLAEVVRVTALLEHSSPSVQRAAQMLGEVVSLGIAACMAYLSSDDFIRSLTTGESSSLLPWLQLWPGKLLIAVSLLVFVLGAALRLARIWSSSSLESVDELEQHLDREQRV